MAGDWIKMRTDLHRDPKVLRMADFLAQEHDFTGWLCPGNARDITVTPRVTVHIVVAGLLVTWCSARAHGQVRGDDLVLKKTPISFISRIAEVPKLGEAMAEVEWLKQEENGDLVFPKCLQHMTSPEERKRQSAAERKRRQREREALCDTERDCHADVTPREEEKRGEEITTTDIGALGLPILPSNIPYREIVALYNEQMGNLPMVREMTKKRRDLIRNAWQAGKHRQTLKFWKSYFEECSEDDFLNGTGPYGKGHENWRPSFDYLMKNDVVTRVYEKAMSQNDAG